MRRRDVFTVCPSCRGVALGKDYCHTCRGTGVVKRAIPLSPAFPSTTDAPDSAGCPPVCLLVALAMVAAVCLSGCDWRGNRGFGGPSGSVPMKRANVAISAEVAPL